MTASQMTTFSRNPALTLDRPLPEGVRDLLFQDATDWRALEGALRQTWRAWGYGEIILPTFEYASTLSTDVGAGIDAEMYRFFDRHGRTLALRPDMTIPTARVVGTRLYDQPLPLRIAYAGSVFRHEAPRAGKQHEFTQVGVELIGASTRAADAEAIALAAAALRAVELPDFRITVGHVGFYRGLASALDLPASVARQIRDAVDRKAEAELELILRQAGGLTEARRAALLALPLLSGPAAILAEARRYVINPLMDSVLDDLLALDALLDAYGVKDVVDYDLSEVRDLDYYTGITFEGYAPGLGFTLVSGGRYDDLIEHFGPPLPAVGWALVLDRLVLAREVQGVQRTDLAPDVLLTGGSPESLRWAAEARRRGLSVAVDPLGLEPAALWSAARAAGIARALSWSAPGRLGVWDAVGQREVGADDWEEVLTWHQAR